MPFFASPTFIGVAIVVDSALHKKRIKFRRNKHISNQLRVGVATMEIGALVNAETVIIRAVALVVELFLRKLVGLNQFGHYDRLSVWRRVGFRQLRHCDIGSEEQEQQKKC